MNELLRDISLVYDIPTYSELWLDLDHCKEYIGIYPSGGLNYLWLYVCYE